MLIDAIVSTFAYLFTLVAAVAEWYADRPLHVFAVLFLAGAIASSVSVWRVARRRGHGDC